MEEDRPWGSYRVLEVGSGYKVKVIEVLPGKRLSYQSHSRRSERWVVVEGIAEITLDDEILTRKIGEIIEIGLKQKHRLANHEENLLKIIEVQIGNYLGEDDIKRFSPAY